MKKNIFKENKYPIYSALIVGFMVLFFYIVNSITPFGDKTILTSDLFHQYAPFLAGLCDKISNAESVLYSIGAGLGSIFLGNFLNYMGSPFNFIVLLFGKNYIQESIALIILLKVALSAFTFTYATKKITNTNNKYLVLFGIMYGISSFFMAFYWNIMWYDAVYMLPVIVLGINRLIKEKKCGLYITSLASSIIINYYMGYMLCIASVIAFFALYFLNYSIKDTETHLTRKGEQKASNRFIASGTRFTLSSITVGLLSCCVLLPVYSILQKCSATGETLAGLSIDFSPFSFIANHMALNTISFRSGSYLGTILPNVYCGVLPLLLIPFYFCNKRVNKKEKIVSSTIIVLFYVSFALNICNFVWHGLHFPNDIPYRFSYIYIFFLLFIAYRGIINFEVVTKKKMTIMLIAISTVLLISGIFFAPNKTILTIPFTIVLIIIYGILLLKQTKYPAKNIYTILMCGILLLEILLPYSNSFPQYSKHLFYKYNQDVEEMKEMIGEDEFYRMELLNNSTMNDSILYNYNGISSFSSMNYHHTSRLQKFLGIRANGLNSNKYCSQTPIYNLAFGVNYILDNDNNVDPDEKYWSKIGTTSNGYDVYESKYKTSIGFSVTSDVSQEKVWKYTTYSPFANQKNFIEFATGLKDSLIHLPKYTYTTNAMDIQYNKEDNPNQEFKYNVTGDIGDAYTKVTTEIIESGHYYAFVLTDNFDITYDVPRMEKVTQSCTTGYIYTYDLGTLETGETFDMYASATVKTTMTGSFNYFVCKVDDDKINDAYNIIKENGIMNVTDCSDTYIKTEIDTKTGYIYTSIPYDENMVITIDGKAATNSEIFIIADSLIGIKTSVGHHTISFEYKQPNVYVGMVISGTTLCILLAYIIIKDQLEKKKNAKV